jgi:hypothetical protein
MPSFSATWVVRLRLLFMIAGLCAAIVILLVVTNQHYKIADWLATRYAVSWAATLAFNVGCLASGHALLRAVLGRVLPIREQLTLAFPLGVLVFFWLTFAVGLCGGLGSAYFFTAPAIMLALGLRPLARYLRRLARHVRYARGQKHPPRSPFTWLAVAFGSVSLAMIYLSILSPLNASWDSRWYHLPIAEQYASSGKVFRFAEGWVLGTYPQLASFIYAWGFMLPKAQLFDRIALAAHLEYSVFVWTVMAVPVLARRVLPKSMRASFRLRGAWAAMFLFPGLFLYDSSLNLGADHIATLWAAPIYLAVLLAWRRLALRECCVLALLISAALLTKYTAVMNVVPAILAVVARALWLTWRALKTKQPSLIPWRSAVAMVVLGIALTSAHWAKNWAWYGDPLYPQLMNHLTLRPWHAEATAPYFTDIAPSNAVWHASRDLPGLLLSLKLSFTFAFSHHDWPDLHGTMPIFGFLFTLSLFVLPFLGRSPRLWLLYGSVHMAVMLWSQISWQDRYLQCLVPWMAAAITATFTQLWHFDRLAAVRLADVRPAALNLARGLLCALIAAQVVYGADVYFYATHRMMRNNPAKVAIDLLNTGRAGKKAERDQIYEPYQKIGVEIPDGSILLVHGTRQTLGLKHRRVVDSPGTQGGLFYARHKSPRAIYDQFKSMGITHLVWDINSESNDTIASDFVFYDFAMRHTEDLKTYGTLRVARMPKKPPTSEPFGQKVAYLACVGRYEPGMYNLHDLSVSVFVPPYSPKRIEDFVEADGGADKLIGRADSLVVQPDCKRGASNKVLGDFYMIARRGTANLYVRKSKEMLAEEAARAAEAKRIADEQHKKNKEEAKRAAEAKPPSPAPPAPPPNIPMVSP